MDEKYKTTSEEQNKENNESAQNTQETEKTENENTNSTENTGNEVETQPEESLENSVTDYTIISNPKIKLLSLIKPYIIPSIIAGIIILLYEGFRYKKLGVVKTLFNLIMLVLISVLSLLSIIVITRFPINIYVCPIIFVLVLIEIILFNIKQEKELGKLNDEE